MAEQRLIGVGTISGVFGVKGWVKVFSGTEPRENILNYSPWIVSKGKQVKKLRVIEGHRQGRAVVACLEGVNDRDDAMLLCGWSISIEQGQLPEIGQDEYYWTDLIGLKVRTTENVDLGVVHHLMETGANDVLVVKGDRERLIPFLQGRTVIEVDLVAGRILVDWDPDF
ncbi:MAG: ribosome maturation factor RimM [Gammaproteobacteria bacterium]